MRVKRGCGLQQRDASHSEPLFPHHHRSVLNLQPGVSAFPLVFTQGTAASSSLSNCISFSDPLLAQERSTVSAVPRWFYTKCKHDRARQHLDFIFHSYLGFCQCHNFHNWPEQHSTAHVKAECRTAALQTDDLHPFFICIHTSLFPFVMGNEYSVLVLMSQKL